MSFQVLFSAKHRMSTLSSVFLRPKFLHQPSFSSASSCPSFGGSPPFHLVLSHDSPGGSFQKQRLERLNGKPQGHFRVWVIKVPVTTQLGLGVQIRSGMEIYSVNYNWTLLAMSPQKLFSTEREKLQLTWCVGRPGCLEYPVASQKWLSPASEVKH